MRLHLSTATETDYDDIDIVECESDCSFVTARTSLSAISEVTTTTTPSKLLSPPRTIKTSTKNMTKSHHSFEKIRLSRQRGSFSTINTIDSSTTNGSAWDGDVSFIDDGDNIEDVMMNMTPNHVTISQEEEPSLIKLLKQQRYDEALICVTRHPEKVSKTCSADDLTFLHLALDRRPLPPCNLVKELIRAYPAAVRIKENSWGFLPLHFACRSRTTNNSNSSTNNNENDEDVSNSLYIIKELLRVYPAAIKETDSFRGMLPLHMAVDSGASLAVVKLLIRKYPESVCFVDDFGDYPIDFARRQRGRCDGALETLLSVAMGRMRQQSLDRLALIEENFNDDNDDMVLSDHQHSRTDSTSSINSGHMETHQTPNQREISHQIIGSPQSVTHHTISALCRPKKLQNKIRGRNSLSTLKMKIKSKILGFEGRQVVGDAY